MAGSQGNVTLIDSAAMYVQLADYEDSSGNGASLLTVTASATGTYTSPDFANTVHKGGIFFINLTTVSATCTMVLSVQAKDPYSGNYGQIARVSIDAVTASFTVRPITWTVYPGIVTADTTLEYHNNSPFSSVCRIVASITATASGGNGATSFTLGLTKII